MAYRNNDAGAGFSGSGGKAVILTEKPSVAKNIGDALGIRGSQKNGYMEGDKYIITWCVGHLVELAQPSAYGDQYEKWTYESLPIIPTDWQYVVKESTKKQFEIVKRLLLLDPDFPCILATDPGREGEAIGRLVYEQAGCRRPMLRLWVSSMEESAIREGMERLKSSQEYDALYEAALCRQHADWLVGINGTRLFTVIYGGKTLKVGRVQSPTLSMLAEREAQILTFKKEPYFITHLGCEQMEGLDAVTEHLSTRAEAEQIATACSNGIAKVESLQKETKSQKPPLLYDLTSLQRDANKLLGYTAKQTLEYAQSLYEKKLLTYPRTDSRYLTDDMTDTAAEVIQTIYQRLSYESNPFEQPDIHCLLNSSKVSDHHAIIPTIEVGRFKLEDLPKTEMKLLSLVACRLLSASAEKLVYESVKAEISCCGYSFKASGRTVLKPGWKIFEQQYLMINSLKKPDEDKDDPVLPDLKEGMYLQPVITRVTDHFTAPPKRYTEATLLAAMERAGASEMSDDVERKGLGTPATRADIIEKLISDGFVLREKKTLVPTQDGMNLITILPDMVKSPQMTAEWENDLAAIAKGELDSIQFMGGIEELVERLVSTYQSVGADQKGMFDRKPEVLGICPHCGKEIRKGRFGPYCSGRCGMTFGRFMGKEFSDKQIGQLLAGTRVLLKGLKSKQGNSYDAYIVPDGIEEYAYTKDDKEIRGLRYRFRMEFPDHNNTAKKGKAKKS